jgi:methionyl-tRNA formyltransferase
MTAALLSRQHCTVVTLQTLAPKFDEGDIIAKSDSVSLDKKNLFTLGLECGELGADLFLDSLVKG